MIELLKKTWWKYIAVILMLYVLIGGMLVPLGPGIKSVYPLTFPSDTAVDFTLTGFNTHFKEAKDVQVWFKNGINFYNADKIEPALNNNIKVSFSFPKEGISTLIGKNSGNSSASRYRPTTALR